MLGRSARHYPWDQIVRIVPLQSLDWEVLFRRKPGSIQRLNYKSRNRWFFSFLKVNAILSSFYASYYKWLHWYIDFGMARFYTESIRKFCQPILAFYNYSKNKDKNEQPYQNKISVEERTSLADIFNDIYRENPTSLETSTVILLATWIGKSKGFLDVPRMKWSFQLRIKQRERENVLN